MISIVLLNWKRLDNVCHLVGQYEEYGVVKEIIVWNNNPSSDLRKELESWEKVRIIQSTSDLGLYTRFAAAFLASEPCILHTDDDIYLPEGTITKLYEQWRKKPDVCHGIFGRPVVNGIYKPQDRYGEVKILLTSCLLCSKVINIYAMQLSKYFDHLPSVPHGNGEDIILSYSAHIVSREFNRAYNYDYFSLPTEDSTSIHTRWSRHFDHRSEVVKVAESLVTRRNPLVTGYEEYIRK